MWSTWKIHKSLTYLTGCFFGQGSSIEARCLGIVEKKNKAHIFIAVNFSIFDIYKYGEFYTRNYRNAFPHNEILVYVPKFWSGIVCMRRKQTCIFKLSTITSLLLKMLEQYGFPNLCVSKTLCFSYLHPALNWDNHSKLAFLTHALESCEAFNVSSV